MQRVKFGGVLSSEWMRESVPGKPYLYKIKNDLDLDICVFGIELLFSTDSAFEF
jgi:hypothetical protein